MIRQTLKRLVAFSERFGVKIITRNSPAFDPMPINVEPEFREIYERCRPYTMTSPGAMYGLFKAVQYIVQNKIPGDIVECGVYKGGSILLCAHALSHFGDRSRKLWLYDTFEGMAEPTSRDVDFQGRTPQTHAKSWGLSDVGEMARVGLDEVRENVYQCDYSRENFVFVKGKVEETIPASIPEKISLLRLDTDWYESTRHELVHLFPRLSSLGVLIVDDYSFWCGAQQAVDEYFKANDMKMLLNRMDRAGEVIGIKP